MFAATTTSTGGTGISGLSEPTQRSPSTCPRASEAPLGLAPDRGRVRAALDGLPLPCGQSLHDRRHRWKYFGSGRPESSATGTRGTFVMPLSIASTRPKSETTQGSGVPSGEPGPLCRRASPTGPRRGGRRAPCGCGRARRPRPSPPPPAPRPRASLRASAPRAACSTLPPEWACGAVGVVGLVVEDEDAAGAPRSRPRTRFDERGIALRPRWTIPRPGPPSA